MTIDYMRVVRAMGGELISLSPKRAKEAGGQSPGMVLRVRIGGETFDLEDTLSKIIDDLAEQVGD